MATLILPDRPPVLDDAEFFIGEPVTVSSWRKMADVINWLNFYARKTKPYSRCGSDNIANEEFLFPVSGPAYTPRLLVVMVAVREHLSSVETSDSVTVKSSTDTTGATVRLYSRNTGTTVGATTLDPKDSTGATTYCFAAVSVTGAQFERITVDITSGGRIDGTGAWELPQGMITTSGRVGGGITPHVASIASTLTDAIDYTKFGSDDRVDADVDGMQTALDNAYARNNTFIFAATPGSGCKWKRPSAVTTYVTVPQGGIWIPPLRKKYTDGTCDIRVSIYVDSATADLCNWRVQTSVGNYGSDNWSSSTAQWRPQGSSYSPTTDGVLATVDDGGEWITIGLQDTTGNANPFILGIMIWVSET